MKTTLLVLFLTIALGTTFATTTTDTIKLQVGSDWAQIKDDGSCVGSSTSICGSAGISDDLVNPGSGTDVVHGSIDGWSVTITGTSYSPGLTPWGIDVSSVTAVCESTTCVGAPTNLDIWYSDINFTKPVTSFNTTYSVTSGTGTGTTSESAWYDTTIFSTANLIGTIGLFTGPGAGTITGGGPAGPSPYSLTLEQVFTAAAVGAGFSVDGNITGNVPEPMSLLLLGGCLFVVGRKLRARLA